MKVSSKTKVKRGCFIGLVLLTYLTVFVCNTHFLEAKGFGELLNNSQINSIYKSNNSSESGKVLSANSNSSDQNKPLVKRVVSGFGELLNQLFKQPKDTSVGSPDVQTQPAEPQSKQPNPVRISGKPKIQEMKVGGVIDAVISNALEKDTVISVVDSEGKTIPAQVIKTQDNETAVRVLIKTPSVLKQDKYQLIVSNGQDSISSNEFNWGVLALNTPKSVYLPGDLVNFAMAVLDETGNMDCEAALTLRIINKDLQIDDSLSTVNKTLTVNPECSMHSYTQKPDYEAIYQVNQVGIYDLTLTAVTKNGTHSITDTLIVADDVPFTIERSVATRIYPVDEYPVQITFIPNEDFNGTITEYIPRSFEIRSDDPNSMIGEQINQGKNRVNKVLTWEVSAQKGERVTLKYYFLAPPKSPDLYSLGPLSVISSDKKTVFTETRAWQLAIDVALPATIYLSSSVSTVLNGTGAAGWKIVTTAPAASNVATSVREGTGTNYFQWIPGVGSTAAPLTNAPTTPNNDGFIVDSVLNSTIPTGNWTFNVRTQNSGKNSTSVGHVYVCAWKVSLVSGLVSQSSLIFCQEGSTNVTGNNSNSLSASVVIKTAVPAVSFSDSEYLYVEYWLRMISPASTGSFSTKLGANAGALDSIVLPGSSANLVPTAPIQNSPANGATNVSPTTTFLMTATDQETNDLGYKVTIYSNSGCSAVVATFDQAGSATGWSGTNSTCIGAPTNCYTSGTQASFKIPSANALNNSTQYWWKASVKDPDGSGTFTNSTSCNSFITAPAVAITLSTSGTVGFGTIALSSSHDTTSGDLNNPQTITVSTGPANLDVRSTAFTASSFTWSLGTSNGADQVQWEFSPDGTAWTDFALPNTLYNLASNVSQGSTQNLYLRLTMPTTTSSYNQYSSTVTIVATNP